MRFETERGIIMMVVIRLKIIMIRFYVTNFLGRKRAVPSIEGLGFWQVKSAIPSGCPLLLKVVKLITLMM